MAPRGATAKRCTCQFQGAEHALNRVGRRRAGARSPLLHTPRSARPHTIMKQLTAGAGAQTDCASRASTAPPCSRAGCSIHRAKSHSPRFPQPRSSSARRRPCQSAHTPRNHPGQAQVAVVATAEIACEGRAMHLALGAPARTAARGESPARGLPRAGAAGGGAASRTSRTPASATDRATLLATQRHLEAYLEQVMAAIRGHACAVFNPASPEADRRAAVHQAQAAGDPEDQERPGDRASVLEGPCVTTTNYPTCCCNTARSRSSSAPT